MKTILTTTLLAAGIATTASAEFNLSKAIQKGLEIHQQHRQAVQNPPVYEAKPAPIYQPKPAPVYQPKPAPVYRPKPNPIVQPEPRKEINVGQMINVLKGNATSSSAPTVTNRTTQVAPSVMPKGYETFRMKQGREKAEGVTPVQKSRVKDGRPMASGEPIPSPGASPRPTPSAPPASLSYQVDSQSQLSTSSVRFRKGSTDLADTASFQYLQNLAAALQDPSLLPYRFVVEGHASADGSDYSNLLLSQRRANAIFDFLMSQGVSSDRLLAVGHGESQARFRPGDPEYLLAQDRQVVVFKLAD
ncbi:MAG: OmpA family protein [Verrucomicrobiota bacterium]